MATKDQSAIKVHQCLFGYRDGHRLLASSIDLSDEAASLLLVLSDLAPGVAVSDTQGYWTGIPLVASKLYALMRTWPAPEMPRPGCVWTHVLLVGFVDISRFGDLSLLARQMQRPSSIEDFDMYRNPLVFEPGIVGGEDVRRPVRDEDALRVIRFLYGPNAHGVLTGVLGAYDEAIFAAWSQQWPRLRRSFSFRTASSASDVAGLGVRFDLCVLLAPILSEADRMDTAAVAGWESVALQDMKSGGPTEFRRFMWRYGSDVRRGRDRFRFLAEIFLATRTASLLNGILSNVLVKVLQALPSPDEGRLLKNDLISCGFGQYSLLPPGDPIALLDFFLQSPEAGKSLPQPIEALGALGSFWPDRSDEILSLGETASRRESELAGEFLKQVAELVDESNFLAGTVDRPALRMRLLQVNPFLLDSDYIARVSVSEILRLVSFIPGNSPLAFRVISRLMVVGDPQLASEVLARFPGVTMKLIADAVGQKGENYGVLVSSAWLRALGRVKAEFLTGGFIDAAPSTTALAIFAEALGHDSSEVVDMGPLMWARGLLNANDDVKGTMRQVFLSFLLALCLAKPVRGCEPLLEYSFETIHGDISGSSLPYEAYSLLVRHLPDLAWWQQWDTCLRLRRAVVRAYMEGGLDLHSFQRLASDTYTFELLSSVARETKRGRQIFRNMMEEAPAKAHRKA